MGKTYTDKMISCVKKIEDSSFLSASDLAQLIHDIT